MVPVQRRFLQLLDGLGAVRFRRRHEADRNPCLTGTPSTAYAVDVDFRIAGQLDVDHHVQRVNVQTTGGYVGRHQHRGATVGEHRQHLVTVTLFQVAMQADGGNALGRQVIHGFLHLLLGEAERYARRRAEMREHLGHGVHALFRRDLVETLLDLVIGVEGFSFHLLRRAHEFRRQLLDAHRVGGREQQGLAACRGLADDVFDGVVEAHVEHTVGFIEDQRVQAVQYQRTFAQVLLDATRGADDDVGAVFQGSDLRAEGHAAAQGKHLDVVFGAGQTTDFLGDLVGQLTRRAHHQGLAAEVARVDRVQQTDTEGGGLAAAGLGLGNQVQPFEDHRQALRLDLRHLDITQRVEVSQHGGGERQSIKSGGDGSHGTGSAKQNVAQCTSPTGFSPQVLDGKPVNARCRARG